MIAIRMRFLAGRFHATPWGHHVNEGVVEYPPSLFRFLRSLVATARRAGLGQVTEEQLRRLVTALSTPPLFHLPPAAVAHTRHYDQANNGVKFFDTFISLNPQDEILWLWPDSRLDETDRTSLAALLTTLGTFGRAESWCEAELLSEDEAQQLQASDLINSRPLKQTGSLIAQETLRLLVPQPELQAEALMRVLETETSVMRKEKQLEPNGTRWLTYTRPAGILTPRRFTRVHAPGPARAVTVARFALASAVLPLVQESLRLGELVRSALLKWRSDDSHSFAFSGKTPDGQPLGGHSHGHFIPTDEDGDGRLDHITVYAPRGFDDADIAALGKLPKLKRYDHPHDIRVALTGLGTAEQFADVPLFRASKHWRSVTPFSLPRFASRGAGKPPRPRDLPDAQLKRELRLRGLPEPVKVAPRAGHKVSGRPLMPWLAFHTRRSKGQEGFGLAGFEIEFAEPVTGPLALGFGCHFGLGLFLPVEKAG